MPIKIALLPKCCLSLISKTRAHVIGKHFDFIFNLYGIGNSASMDGFLVTGTANFMNHVPTAFNRSA